MFVQGQKALGTWESGTVTFNSGIATNAGTIDPSSYTIISAYAIPPSTYTKHLIVTAFVGRGGGSWNFYVVDQDGTKYTGDATLHYLKTELKAN